MKIDRAYFDVPTEVATVKIANSSEKKNLGHVEVIDVDVSMRVKVRSSDKSVKYRFSRPVTAYLKEENGARKLRIHDG